VSEQVRAAADKPEASIPPSTPNTAETPLWAQFSRIGGNLSPAGVSQIILEADGGSPSRFVDLLHECRQKDGTMHEVTSLRELGAACLDWSIELPANAKRRDKKAASALTTALQQCDTLQLLFAHEIGEGNAFGYAFSEALWDYGSSGELSGILYPKQFTPVHSRRFGYRQSDGKLVFLPGISSSPDRDGVDLFQAFAAGNYIGNFPRINGDAMVREGYGRMLVWMALFRNWDIRDWLQFGELGWKPWRIGYYNREIKNPANSEDRLALERALKMLASTGAALLPDTVKFLVEWPKGGAANLQSTHAELAAFLGQEMAKGVLGGTLSSDSGVRGARSLGEVHDRMRVLNRDFDAANINAFMTRYVCKPFYAYNYGANVIPGRFVCNVRETLDLEKLANAIDKLAGKIDIPQEWVRNQGGIRAPIAGEQLVIGCAPATATDPSKQTPDGKQPEGKEPDGINGDEGDSADNADS
jgi:phage gp29-like protein